MNTSITFRFLTAVSISLHCAWAYPTYQGCEDLKDDDFKHTTVIGLSTKHNPLVRDPTMFGPIDLAFDAVKGADGNVLADIYWIERGERKGVTRPAMVKYFDAVKKTVTKLADFDVGLDDPTNENGMTGIALDPNFKQNGWIYLHYSTDPVNKAFFRIARYTVKNNKLDKSTEKILFDIPINSTSCCHSGGPLVFDDYGDLWIGTGDQANYRCNNREDADSVTYRGCFQTDKAEHSRFSAEWNAASTASLLGAWLRIHPDDKAPKGYTIPKDNFGEYWAKEFEKQGKKDLAEEYRNPAKVLPELYAKGTRNPYAMRLDPVRRWVMEGNCGPDGPRTKILSPNRHSGPTEEFNLFTRPEFMGWPYFSGTLVWHDEKKDALKPINDSPFNKGVKELPPVSESIYAYERQCAMTGPIYRYDPALKSGIKLPPHFHRIWWVTDFNKSWVKAFTLNEDGSKIVKVDDAAWPGKTFHKPLAMDIGPDGALYIVNYAGYNSRTPDTRISRIEYAGNCKPAQVPFTIEKVGCKDKNYQEFDPAVTHPLQSACKNVGTGLLLTGMKGLDFTHTRVKITLRGQHIISLHNLSGKTLFIRKAEGSREYKFREMKMGAIPGIYLIRIVVGKQSVARKVTLM